jgi:hypothetical protein
MFIVLPEAKAVADAGFKVGGIEGCALRKGGQNIEHEQDRHREQWAQTHPDFFW